MSKHIFSVYSGNSEFEQDEYLFGAETALQKLYYFGIFIRHSDFATITIFFIKSLAPSKSKRCHKQTFHNVSC